MIEPLPEEYIATVVRDARRYQGQWTGTAGTLAAHCMRLLRERKRMLESTRDDLTTAPSDAIRDAWDRFRQQAQSSREPIARRVYGVNGSMADARDSAVAPAEEASSAEQLLDAAREAVRSRRQTYGPCTEHFARTVGAINAIFARKLREQFTAAEWAQVMIIDKLAREQERPHPDNAVDAAGYSACWHEAAGR